VWRRKASGLVGLALVALLSACGGKGPSEGQLRKLATTAEAERSRATAEQEIRATIASLDERTALKLAFVRLSDSCSGPRKPDLFNQDTDPYVLTCTIGATAYFGARGEISETLRSIDRADITVWGSRDGRGDVLPHTAGSVDTALGYYLDNGLRDGTRLPEPRLSVASIASMELSWDQPLFEKSQIDEVEPCVEGPDGPNPRYRCVIEPDGWTVGRVRAQYGTVYQLDIVGRVYHQVPQ
jgi:hypothetical protein